MKYTNKSFTVPVSEADGSYCKEKGHSALDAKGRCFCCGEQIRVSVPMTDFDTVGTIVPRAGLFADLYGVSTSPTELAMR